MMRVIRLIIVIHTRTKPNQKTRKGKIVPPRYGTSVKPQKARHHPQTKEQPGMFYDIYDNFMTKLIVLAMPTLLGFAICMAFVSLLFSNG